nr:RNA ligase (ATP) [Candidatus Sigynarchaeota archaeon]
MSRKLARLEIVTKITQIDNADAIEVAHILGWQCVVKKGEVQVGEPVVYFEIDSFLPIETRYEFLRKSSYKVMEIDGGDGIIKKVEGFRLKTIKLRGQVSQGLAMPVRDFQDILREDLLEPGTDLTGVLGILLYEKPISINMRGMVKGNFPGFINKTDQERIQNHPEYFETYRDLAFEVTEKIDGTSSTLYIGDDGELNVCSRNLNLKDDGGSSVYWMLAQKLHLKERIASAGTRYALQ